jgi:hypothetical protein
MTPFPTLIDALISRKQSLKTFSVEGALGPASMGLDRPPRMPFENLGWPCNLNAC